jgi:hypothetical protein
MNPAPHVSTRGRELPEEARSWLGAFARNTDFAQSQTYVPPTERRSVYSRRAPGQLFLFQPVKKVLEDRFL